MKIAVTAVDDKMESLIDPRFGRSRYFMVLELEGDTVKSEEAVKNQGPEQGHGAGICAAQQLGELEVEAVITGEIGPNATEVLKKLGIKAFHGEGKVSDALVEFSEGNLTEIKEIAQPHSGITGNEQKIDNKKDRIFFPLMSDNGLDSEISQHFGHAPLFGIYDCATKKFEIKENKLEHDNAMLSPVDQVIQLANPTVVYALGIGSRAIQLFNQKGISIKTGEYQTPREVIENLDKVVVQDKDCGQGRH